MCFAYIRPLHCICLYEIHVQFHVAKASLTLVLKCNAKLLCRTNTHDTLNIFTAYYLWLALTIHTYNTKGMQMFHIETHIDTAIHVPCCIGFIVHHIVSSEYVLS